MSAYRKFGKIALLLSLMMVQGAQQAFAEEDYREQEYKEDDSQSGNLAGGKFRLDASATVAKIFFYAASHGTESGLGASNFLFLGPQVTAEYQILRWLSLGLQYRGLFELLSNAKIHDVDSYAKFIFPSVKNDASEFYFKLPAGFSIEDVGLSAKLMGFNVGAMLGGNYFFNRFVGFTAEAGYVYRRATNKSITHRGITDKYTFQSHEIATALGIIIRI